MSRMKDFLMRMQEAEALRRRLNPPLTQVCRECNTECDVIALEHERPRPGISWSPIIDFETYYEDVSDCCEAEFEDVVASYLD